MYPMVAGVGGGVGTTIIASALHAFDDDLYVDGSPVDVLVCRSTRNSVTEAHRALAHAPYPPVLAVVADLPAGAKLPLPPREVTALTRIVEPHVSGMVAVPYVSQWRTRDAPDCDAATLLDPNTEIPQWLADFAESMTRLIRLIEGPLRARISFSSVA
jgi:hypothetical protein